MRKVNQHKIESYGRTVRSPLLHGSKNAGVVLLSHTLMYSTIAAEVLNFRVRDVNGCVNLAIDTGKKYKKLYKKEK